MAVHHLTLVPPSPPGDEPPRTPCDEVVAQLETLLTIARGGSITSFCYAAVGDPEGPAAIGWSGPHRNAMIAGSHMIAGAVEWKRVD